MEDINLAIVLTAAGATLSAALIASVIEVAKKIPALGPWLDAKHEALASYVFAAGLIVWAVIGTGQQLTAMTAFADFLAWLGIAKLAGAAYDAGADAKDKVVSMLSGGG